MHKIFKFLIPVVVIIFSIAFVLTNVQLYRFTQLSNDFDKLNHDFKDLQLLVLSNLLTKNLPLSNIDVRLSSVQKDLFVLWDQFQQMQGALPSRDYERFLEMLQRASTNIKKYILSFDQAKNQTFKIADLQSDFTIFIGQLRSAQIELHDFLFKLRLRSLWQAIPPFTVMSGFFLLFIYKLINNKRIIQNQIKEIRLSSLKIEKEIQEKIAISERLRLIIDAAPEAILFIDRKGSIKDCNSKVFNVLGYLKHEMIGSTIFDYVNTRQQLRARELLNRIFSNKHIGDERLTVLKKNGQEIIININASMIEHGAHKHSFFICILNDITERIEAENAILTNWERYQRLFNTMRSGVAVYQAVNNGADFVFMDFNHAAENIENVSRAHIIGRKVTDVFPGVKKLGLFDTFRRVYRTGESEFLPMALYKDQNTIGSWRENWVYKLPTGEIVCVYEDVTGRKEAQDKLERHRNHLEELVAERTKQLAQSEKLAAIGRLVASIAHEINNPLQGITTHLGMLEDNHFENYAFDESYTCLKEGLRRIKKIVKQLLDVFRGQEENFTEVKINDIVTRAITLVKNKIDIQNIHLVVDLAKEHPVMLGVEQQLYQVVLNLILNAIDATGQHGRISVKTFSVRDHIEIWVQDSGEGVPNHMLKHIFEPFYSTKKSEGIGLGLFVCQQLVQHHSGQIQVESSSGNGSTFKIVLPKNFKEV